MSDHGKKAKDEIAGVAGFVFDLFCGDVEERLRKTARDVDAEFFGRTEPPPPAPPKPRAPAPRPTPPPVVVEGELVDDDE